MDDTSMQKDRNEEPETLIGSSSSVCNLEPSESADLRHSTGWIGRGKGGGIGLVQTSPLNVGHLFRKRGKVRSYTRKGGESVERSNERREGREWKLDLLLR